MGIEDRIRVIVTPVGLDGHTTGAEVVAKMLRDAGMEVVYLGIYQMPAMIVEAALQEDADVIGISSHSSNYHIMAELMDLIKEKGLDDILVICGGTIPEKHAVRLKEAGISEVFPPGSSSESIVNFIRSHVRGKGHKQGL